MTTSQLAARIDADTSRKRRAMLWSIGVAALLTIAKLVVAGLTGSVAVLSEAVHSMTDLIAAGIVWYSLGLAGSPPDETHRYGHEKLENISAVAEGTIIIAAVAYVVFRSIERLANGASVEMPLVAVAVMLVSMLATLAVALHLRRVGRETDSAAVSADAQQLLVDVYTSAAVAVGLTLVAVTGWEWLDPVVAIGVSAFVVRIGLTLIIGSTRVLLDESLPADEVELISRLIYDEFGDTVGFHRLRTRRGGSRRYVDLHLTLDGSMPLYRAHEIAHRVEAVIERALRNVDVLTHIEPHTEAPPPGVDEGPSDRA